MKLTIDIFNQDINKLKKLSQNQNMLNPRSLRNNNYYNNYEIKK